MSNRCLLVRTFIIIKTKECGMMSAQCLSTAGADKETLGLLAADPSHLALNLICKLQDLLANLKFVILQLTINGVNKGNLTI